MTRYYADGGRLDEALRSVGEAVQAACLGAVSGVALKLGELTVAAEAGRVLDVLGFLRDNPRLRFVSLVDICGVDWPGRAKRFDVVYHLLSPAKNLRVRVKIETDEVTPVASAVDLFPSAGWYEREAYDLYGILFDGHPDLRRLLTDYGFDGHPLRKDFPLTGYVEVRWDDEHKRVVYEPVRLMQEFRNFDFLSPWEGPNYELPGDEKARSGDKG